MLIIEVDGTQHAGSFRDMKRDAALHADGYEVVRFWNDDIIRDLHNVCMHIIRVAEMRKAE